MQKYRINIETGQKEKDNGQLGASFYSQDWREATSIEVKAIELEKLKEAKILEAQAPFILSIFKRFSKSSAFEAPPFIKIDTSKKL